MELVRSSMLYSRLWDRSSPTQVDLVVREVVVVDLLKEMLVVHVDMAMHPAKSTLYAHMVEVVE